MIDYIVDTRTMDTTDYNVTGLPTVFVVFDVF